MLAALASLPAPASAQDDKRILLYSGTTGFRHTDAINQGVPVVKAAVEAAGYQVDVEDCSGSACATADENPRVFTDANLAKYDAILLFNVSSAVSGPDVLWNQAQRDAIIRFVQNGGGIAGNHNATDMGAGQQTWSWWDGGENSAVGTLMKGHAATDLNNKATVQVADHHHLATRDLPDTYQFGDEHYNFVRSVRGTHHVLATLNEKSYTPGTNAMGADHPISWCKLYDGDAVNDGTGTPKRYTDGRVWVTGMGHFGANYTDRGGDNEIVKQIVGGVRWAAGEGKKSDCSGTVWANFTRTVLVNNVQGPIGMDVAADGKVYWTEIGPTPGYESEGFLKVYDPTGPANNKTTVLRIETRADHGNSEDGVLGMTLENGFDLADPAKRHVFIYYSPRGPWPTSGTASITLGYNQISRFTLTADGKSVEAGSERVILRVPKAKIVGSPSNLPDGTARGDSGPGHVGGAGLDFDSEGNLYLGVGDDVSPNADGHNGYPPMDYRAKERWDARKTSANSADLRGKVLRIKPLDDIAADAQPGVGTTYAIPQGNMFTPGTEKTRPEIYAMGFRQPFTVHADPKFPGHVVVGEYCHDNGSDFAKRAPAGTCEWDLVDKPGFMGWPFCVGDNSTALTTWRWNYATNTTTDQQYNCALSSLPSDIRYAPDGQSPVEPSNDGLDTLPGPAVPATIWKKYGGLKGTSNDTDPGNIDPGGMSPVTGPIYRYQASTAKPGAFPPYYDGSWFITNRGDANGGWWKEAHLRKDDGKLLRVNDWVPISPASQAGPTTTVIPSRFGPDGALYMARWDSGCCRDGHGGVSTELVKIEFNVQDECLEDTAAPTTSATLAGRKHPTEADTYLTDATLSINAADNGCAGVSKVEYRVGDGAWTEYTSPRKFDVPGTYTVEYRATDTKGNEAAVKQVTFKVVEVNDHEGPTVTATVTGDKVGENYTAPATLKLVATDPLSSITSIEYRVNQADAFESVDFSGENLSEEFTRKFAEPGFKFIEYRATDESGNTSEIGSVQFSVVAGCVYPGSDEFDGPLDAQWLRHTRNGGTPTTGDKAPTVANGQLTMPTHDFELDGNSGTTSVGPVNFVGRDLPKLGGAWSVETEFTAQFTGGWQSMGLMLWNGDDNFFRSSLTHSLGGTAGQRQLYIEQSKDSPSSNPEGARSQAGGNVNLTAGYNGPVTIRMRYARAAGSNTVSAQYRIIAPAAQASPDWVAFPGPSNFLDLNPSSGPRRDAAGSRIGVYSQGNFPGTAGTFAYAGTPGTMKVEYFRVTSSDALEPDCADDDVTPPSTAVALDPAEPGIGGTYTGPVDVNFTATDAESVDYTQVKIDDGPWQKNENDDDDSPFASTTTVDALGAHTVQYRSADKAGNLEPAKSFTFVIEKTPASQVRDIYAAGTQWDPTEAEVNFGEKVTWHFPATEINPHNVKLIAPGADEQTGGTFISDQIVPPGSPPVSYTFRKAGTWTFLCTIHVGMKGVVKVGADPNPGDGDGDGDGDGGGTPPPAVTPPTPSGNTPPLPTPTAKAAKLGKLPKTSLASFLKKGIKVSSACQSGLKGKVTASLSKRQVRKLGGKRTLTLASKSVTCASTGKASVRLKASKKAKKMLRKALRKHRSLSVSVSIKMGSGSAASSDRRSLRLSARK